MIRLIEHETNHKKEVFSKNSLFCKLFSSTSKGREKDENTIYKYSRKIITLPV